MIKKQQLALRPSYWASFSGGKDSLYMLYLIFNNPNKYPLDGVVYFDLEIDYPFIKNIVSIIQNKCEIRNLNFFAIKPRESWESLYNKYGYPSRVVRWCNSRYKLDCKKQLDEFLKSKGFYAVNYIGYCFDETKRYLHRSNIFERYPLVEEKIFEKDILEWAKKQDIYNNYYKYNTRCGCMGCPMSSLPTWAYLKKYYPNEYFYFISKMSYSDFKYNKKDFYNSANYIDLKMQKYIFLLESAEKYSQISFFD